MEGSNYVGVMAVVAASGSVVLVALQAHRRMVSGFRKELELVLGAGGEGGRLTRKKKVRFAADVAEPSSNNKEYRRRHSLTRGAPEEAWSPL